MHFLNQAFGLGLFSGTLNLLLWFSYVVILSFYLKAFGSYGVSLFGSTQPIWKHLLISLAILGTTGLNLLTANYIGKSQIWIVSFKVGILILFITMGSNHIDISRLEPVSVSSLQSIFAGAMVILLALGILIWFALQTDPQTVWVLVFMLGVAIGIEVIYYLSNKR
ncbi:hypothetical protein NSTC745_01015 [Nostoc sp. DSM 114161]|jgi:amino acid transporter